MYVQLILGSVKVAEWPPFGGKSCSLRQPRVLFLSCILVVIVIFHFVFEDRILVLIVLVPGHFVRSSLTLFMTKIGPDLFRNKLTR